MHFEHASGETDDGNKEKRRYNRDKHENKKRDRYDKKTFRRYI